MIVLTFKSTHEALEIEEALLEAEIGLMVIPTPKIISEGCGIALKFEESNLKKVKRIVETHDIIEKRYFKETITGGNKEYTYIE